MRVKVGRSRCGRLGLDDSSRFRRRRPSPAVWRSWLAMEQVESRHLLSATFQLAVDNTLDPQPDFNISSVAVEERYVSFHAAGRDVPELAADLPRGPLRPGIVSTFGDEPGRSSPIASEPPLTIAASVDISYVLLNSADPFVSRSSSPASTGVAVDGSLIRISGTTFRVQQYDGTYRDLNPEVPHGHSLRPIDASETDHVSAAKRHGIDQAFWETVDALHGNDGMSVLQAEAPREAGVASSGTVDIRPVLDLESTAPAWLARAGSRASTDPPPALALRQPGDDNRSNSQGSLAVHDADVVGRSPTYIATRPFGTNPIKGSHGRLQPFELAVLRPSSTESRQTRHSDKTTMDQRFGAWTRGLVDKALATWAGRTTEDSAKDASSVPSAADRTDNIGRPVLTDGGPSPSGHKLGHVGRRNQPSMIVQLAMLGAVGPLVISECRAGELQSHSSDSQPTRSLRGEP